LEKLRTVVAAGVFATARHWTPLRIAASWIARIATTLANPAGADAATVEAALREVLAEVLMYQHDAALAEWATHVYRVTRTYWPGLFHCYDDPTIPRTNNDLEQYFGTARHHERRATGRKRPAAAVAVRGAVRVVAAVATQVAEVSASDLRPRELAAWQALRARLEARHARRRASRRFRRDPAAYLAWLMLVEG
jgi:hypothetical protein